VISAHFRLPAREVTAYTDSKCLKDLIDWNHVLERHPTETRRRAGAVTAGPLSTAAAAPAAPALFLSPEWIHQVAQEVEAAKRTDPYFLNLVTNFSLTVLYSISGIPRSLRRCYGGDEAQIFVKLHKGTARRIEVGGPPAGERIDVRVTVDYDIARRLFLGELSPAASIINRLIKAEPSSGFRRWPLVAARGLVTANRVLRAARTVPTAFEPQRNGQGRPRRG
jgi:hypothetical protein